MSHKSRRSHVLVAVGVLLVGLSLMACNRPTPTESPTAMPTESITAIPAEGATAIPTDEGPPITVPPEVAVVQIPAEIRRVFDIVWAGKDGPDPTSLTRLEDDEWRDLPAEGWVTTDNDGEGWVRFTDCMLIYIFQDSRLVKEACPKSDYEGGNVSCAVAGTSVFNNQCAAQIVIQTPSSQIKLEGSWLSVTYLPERQLSLILVFEGQAKVQSVLDADDYTLGEAVDVPTGNFWFSTPGISADPIAGLSARELHPFDQLLPVVEELNLWSWIDRITSRADMDNIPYPAIPPFVPGPTATPCGPPSGWMVYVVQVNDTLFSLASETGTSVEQVKLANCLEGDTLVAGESIFLPSLPPTDTPTPTPTPTPVPTPTVTPVPPSADLGILKTDSADPVSVNQAYSYAVTVFNNGPFAAQGVRVTDSLPAGVMTKGVSTIGCNNDPDGVPICDLGIIGAGASLSFTINVTAPSTLEIVTNNASVTSSTDDPDASNNATSEDTRVIPRADLRIAKLDSADPVLPAEVYTYTVIILNDGPSDAQNVTVGDTLPDGAIFNYTSGCNNDPNGVPTCELGTIAADGTKSFAINVTAPRIEGIITNTASVTSSTDDPDASNNTTSEPTEIIAWADLRIEKIGPAVPVSAYQPYTYTVTVFNDGPFNAQEVTVNDRLEGGAMFFTTPGCNITPDRILMICDLDTIRAGDSTSFTVEVEPPLAAVTVTNLANVTSRITDDPKPSNNYISTTTTIYLPEP